MHRLRVGAMLVLAVLLAAQLALHHHSLIPESDGAALPLCVVCAFGADRIILELPVLAAAALALAGFLTLPGEVAPSSLRLVPARGRAPPSSSLVR